MIGKRLSLGMWLLFALPVNGIGASGEPARTERGDEERFQWRGQVDGVDEICIRGDTVRIRHLAAKPIQRQDYRSTAPLPRREVELELHEIDGRGEVRLVEEPSAWNDYTAVVRIDDAEQHGDAYYEFELRWQENDPWGDWHGDEEWTNGDGGRGPDDGWDRREGAFRWEGRVDIGADIEIRGKRHVVNDAGGQGTEEYRYRFQSSLPRERVPVSLHRTDGRGKVELIQTPSAENDYTAILRIEDPKNGADVYGFELTWRTR